MCFFVFKQYLGGSYLNKKKLNGLGILLIGLIILCTFFIYQNSKINNTTSQDYKVMPNGLGISVHPLVTEQDIKSIADAGFKWVRIDIFWDKVETKKGSYDFKKTGYDELNKWLKEYEIKPYYTLSFSNKLYEKDRSIVTQPGREGFANFVTAATSRYKNQSGIWEIWNEPNIDKFWNPQPNIRDYMSLVKKISPIIREQDPTAVIVAPAIAGTRPESLKWLEKALKSDLLNYIDLLSVHPYRDSNPETVVQDYKKIKNLIKTSSDKNISVISGEWGYSTQGVSERVQAEYLTRMVLTNSQQSIPISILYNWKNDGTDLGNKEHNFGITWRDSNLKLSYVAVQTLTKQLKGYRYTKILKYGLEGDYILEFKNENENKILAFWTTSSNHKLTIPLEQGKGKLISMLGAFRNVEWKGELEINLSSSPNYLVIE